MAMFLLLNNFGSHWDDYENNDIFDVISGGFHCFREVLQSIKFWFKGEEFDTREIAEVTQSFALRVLIYTYHTVTWVIHYTCAVLIYIFSDIDSMTDAIDYVRPTRNSVMYKSVTSLILYEKPVAFDYNPFHWFWKLGQIVMFGPVLRMSSSAPVETEDSFLTMGKLFMLATLSLFLYKVYSLRQRKLSLAPDVRTDRTFGPHDTDSVGSPRKYEGLIKWEAGLVRCNSEKQDDHLSLKISVNSNICSDNTPCKYDDMIASSTASICKIVSDVLTNASLDSREITFERNEDVTPRRTEQLTEEETVIQAF